MRIVWKLEISGYSDNKDEISYKDLEDIDIESISNLIKNGYTSGVLNIEEEK